MSLPDRPILPFSAVSVTLRAMMLVRKARLLPIPSCAALRMEPLALKVTSPVVDLITSMLRSPSVSLMKMLPTAVAMRLPDGARSVSSALPARPMLPAAVSSIRLPKILAVSLTSPSKIEPVVAFRLTVPVTDEAPSRYMLPLISVT